MNHADRASNLIWRTFHHFRADEWPEDVLPWLNGRVVRVLEDVRRLLPSQFALTPSPDPQAHVRHEAAGSRHSTADRTRLSDATDVFARNRGEALAAWVHLIRHPLVGGLGLYEGAQLNGEPRPLLHVDLRPLERDMPLLWVATREAPGSPWAYTYQPNDARRFQEELARVLNQPENDDA